MAAAREFFTVDLRGPRAACRHGYRMLYSRLRIDGWAINAKRTYRVHREEV